MACEDPTPNATNKADSNEQAFADLDSFTAETFAPYLYDRFTVHPDCCPQTGAETVELQLVEVGRFDKLKQLEGGFDHRPRAPFSLLFRGSHQVVLPGAVWTIEHRELGVFQLFLTPVQVSSDYPADQNPEGMFYESVFS